MRNGRKMRRRLDEMVSVLLCEGAETRNMSAAKHYLYNYGYDETQALKYIGQIKTDIPNSRLAKCKFMLGLVRMCLNHEFTDGKVVTDVNKSLKYAASDVHVNEYNQDLNGMTASQLVEKFAVSVTRGLEDDRKDVASEQYNGGNYEVVKIPSFEDAEQYADYVTWCITQYPDMYASYTGNGNGVFYFCLRNGWEDEEEVAGEGCPLDSYGLSMIAVSVNADGSCNTITCRWNHDHGGNDNIMTPKELSRVIGRNFYDTFKPLTPEEREKIMRQKIYDIGEEITDAMYYYDQDLSSICGKYWECDPDNGDRDGQTYYCFDSDNYGGCVLLDEDWDFVTEMVFDDISGREGDVFVVESGNRYNFLTTSGKLLSDTWFENVINRFGWGYGYVMKHDKKWNLMDKEGNLILNEWHNGIKRLQRSNIVEVFDDGKSNYIDLSTGRYIFERPVTASFSPDGGKTMFIKLDGDDYFMIYERNMLRLIAPWQVSELLGHYNAKNGYFYCIRLTDGNRYFIDNGGNLHDTDTGQIVQYNPYNNGNAQGEE